MVMLVTLQEASDHLRRDTTDDDDDLTIKIKAASAAVLNYIETADFIDSSGEPDYDSSGDAIVPFDVKAATLILVGMFYKDRDGVDASKWPLGYLPMPVVSLLYPYREPTCK